MMMSRQMLIGLRENKHDLQTAKKQTKGAEACTLQPIETHFAE